MPGFGLPLKYFLFGGVVLPTVINFISASIVILTQGKGKNGSTVAVRILHTCIHAVIHPYMYIQCHFKSWGQVICKEIGKLQVLLVEMYLTTSTTTFEST